MAIVIVVGILFVLYYEFLLRRKVPQAEIERIQEAWRRIIRERDMRHAILEADKLLDHALFLKGYRGNLGVKLKKAQRLFGGDINRVWSAHKVRNNIAHQIGFQVDEKGYRSAMLAFRDALRKLKIFE